jgi:PhnB protein
MKATSHIPRGFHTVTPYLVVQNVERLLTFLKHAFNAEELLRMSGPDGSVGHAMVKIGDSLIEMGEAQGQWKPMPAGLHFYVEDADAVYKRAIDAGGTSLHEPKDMFYGERSGAVKDPSGNHWYIATHIEDLSDEEMQQRAAAAAQG